MRYKNLLFDPELGVRATWTNRIMAGQAITGRYPI